MLADADAGDVRLDRLELTPDLRRRLRLHVECFQVRGPAVQEQEDRVDRLLPLGRRSRPQAKQFRQGQPHPGQHAHFQEVAPRAPRTVASYRSSFDPHLDLF
jgi:hypothetical protein